MKGNSKKRRIVALLCAVVAATAIAGVGQSVTSVLEIEPGVAGLGMAGAVGSRTGDVESLYYNPAGLASLEGLSLTSSYSSQWGESNYTGFGVAFNGWALGYLMFNSGDVEGRDDTGSPTETLSYKNNAALFAFGLGENQLGFLASLPVDLSIGGRLKFVTTSFGETSGSGMAVDLSTQIGFNPVRLGGFSITDMRVGLAMLDLFGRLNYGENDEYTEPFGMDLRASFSAMLFDALVFGFDFGPVGTIHLGVEYTLLDLLAIRAGMLSLADVFTFTIGIGLDLQGIGIDYALETHNNLSATHRIGVTIDLGRLNLGSMSGILQRILP